MLLDLDNIRFSRCIKPKNSDENILPDLVTFSDGNPDAYGVVSYAVFTLKDSSKVANFLMSKAKLGPLTHKGETVRNELSGSTIASHIKVWLVQESDLVFGTHFHFLDTRIVLDMIHKQSYGFNTFAGLRVGEIQQKTSLDDWLHVPSKENIADILTKGETPEKLGMDSCWQKGPSWLVKPRSDWPVTVHPANCSDDIETEVSKFYRKSTAIAAIAKFVLNGSNFPTDGIDGLISRCGSL